ncbi:MAG: PTS sugar transporter subunit IIA [Planctomycetes bacterium]|nr:PTS sugar transporter subunit IIA [Planctomycetota bacterium]
MLLSQVLQTEDICLNLKSSRKIDAIKEIVDHIASTGKIVDKVGLFQAIIEREELQSTALNCGAAVPHARIDAALARARTDAVRGIIMALGISQQGIDFDAPDNSPANLIFLIAAPKTANSEYIHLLEHVCKLLEVEGFREKMLLAEHPGQVMQTILAGETTMQQ